jgi:hypothetical protein
MISHHHLLLSSSFIIHIILYYYHIITIHSFIHSFIQNTTHYKLKSIIDTAIIETPPSLSLSLNTINLNLNLQNWTLYPSRSKSFS